jgi:hypothetical protein
MTKSRSSEYRERAAELRAKADGMQDAQAVKAMLETASLWERMADWEDKIAHTDPPFGTGSP